MTPPGIANNAPKSAFVSALAGERARAAFHALALLFAAYVFFLSLRPLSDPDVWWHLATGEWIVENSSLPGNEDPFSYTAPNPLPEGQVKGLRSQWLGQVLFYLAYLAGGHPGVALFRSLLILLPFAFLYVRSLRAGVHPLSALSSLAPPLFLIAHNLYNTFERPQSFSFLLALAVFLMLDAARRGKGIWLWLLPVVMLVGANLHGGYIVGVALILAYAAGDAAAGILRRLGVRVVEEPSAGPVMFSLACAAAIAASGLNPGGYRLLGMLVRKALGLVGLVAGGAARAGTVAGEILEYKPLWYFYSEVGLKWPVFITAFYVLALAALVVKFAANRRVDLPEAFSAIFIFLFGMYYSKGVDFALIFLAYVAVDSIRYIRGPGKTAVPLALAALCIWVAVYIGGTGPSQLKPRFSRQWIAPSYPEEAIHFLKEKEVEGPLFNSLAWGGYFIWRGYPEYKVFYDGREAVPGMLETYMDVMGARKGWQGILEAYDVNVIVLPIMSELNGVISPLVLALLETKNDEWKIVYVFNNVVVFVRDDPKNRDIMDCCGKSYRDLALEILNVSDSLLAARPGHANLLFAKAVSLYELGIPGRAEAFLRQLPPSRPRDLYLEKIRTEKK